MIHDGSGTPDKVNSQEGADSETFVMGSNAAELVNNAKCEVDRKECRTLQIQEKSIQ